MINPIYISLVLAFLAPLWGWGSAQIVLHYGLPNLLGVYMVLSPWLLFFGYTIYWARKHL